jgi:hypothetical protein
LGGCSKVAEIAGVVRSTPYKWQQTGNIGTDNLCTILEWCARNKVKLDVGQYFERVR